MSARILSLAALLSFCACGFGLDATAKRPCTSDDQCQNGQACFADGCGDPNEDLRVEVTPNVQAGYYAQDFVIERLSPTQDLNVLGPSTIGGLVQQKLAPQSQPTVLSVAYRQPMSFTISGESSVIPGLRRSFSSTVNPQDDGSYSLNVASGTFSVVAASSDTSVPPSTEPNQVVEPGKTVKLNVTLPAREDLFRVDGRLVRTGSIPVQATEMMVQALDPLNKQPLSQAVPASSGQVGSTGDFTLWLSPTVKSYSEFIIQASPKDPTAKVPSKMFTVSLESTLNAPLELGDYGSPVNLSGSVVGFDGVTMAGATVYVEGTVNGQGTFKSDKIFTDSAGTFTLSVLPNAPGSSYSLWVVPPAKSNSAILKKSVSVTSDTQTGTIKCPARPVVMGSVVRSTGEPAVNVKVVAEPLSSADGQPLPSSGVDATTDDNGQFVIPLAPARYRLDFIPQDPNDPRASRFLTVTAQPEGAQLNIGAMPLSSGQKVHGVISAPDPKTTDGTLKPMPYAAVRFFRKSLIEGKESSVLMAEGLADANGKYEVTLPAASNKGGGPP